MEKPLRKQWLFFGMGHGAWSMDGRHDASVVGNFVGNRRPETGDRKKAWSRGHGAWTEGMMLLLWGTL
ncbi:MAG: hypothetical protein LWW85_01655 [Marinilabiliales bacterium]|nr:hypothetical protein [Marinilabiliales bacterium]